ncbi:UDP-N-acetylglucosamine transferase subunit ALG13 homolog [Planococcus citri]|uniref:UDP-N-acetylglucosamine transferase subunit ALG13 homolog n=1 Tax=Planococcus citri TaxID=170843 RepID=UPI0031F84BED
MEFKNVFVTVGTTEFQNLIDTVTSPDILQILKRKGCKNLKIQYGSGDCSPSIDDDVIFIECYGYKDSLHDDMSEADLIISHAGAGTCLEALELRKPLITVINDELMHNHQTELAEKLSDEGYSFCCTCSSLSDVLQNSKFDNLKTFIYDNDKKCAAYVEKLLCNKII